jgi:PHD/YefM family antitoxin component YafN of YafNO toxin-antitoxin module
MNNDNEVRIVKELKEKPVYYVKADKGNAVVIIDKEDYDTQMTDRTENFEWTPCKVW